MTAKFISESIKPITATSDAARMAAGEPGLPKQFIWRKQTIEIKAVLRTWRETGACRHGSPEHYVRKHWYEVCTAENQVMRIYFERQPRRGEKAARWWLLSIADEIKISDNEKNSSRIRSG